MKAIVNISIDRSAGKPTSALTKIQGIPGVTSADLVYGRWDAVAIVEGTESEVSAAVLRIARLSAVSGTETLIVAIV